tara:strand:- start:364 stop:552 length:189 start_codon:yes stop_codon:yes gene_type:complete
MDKNTLIKTIKNIESVSPIQKNLYKNLIEEISKDSGNISPPTVRRCASHIKEFMDKGGNADV